MDKLQKCAKAFEKLLQVEYNIIIARKKNLINLTLRFDKVDFHHLMGLHKLRDLRLSRASRASVFDNIINNKIDFQTISLSRYIGQISDRFEPLSSIENLIDSNELIFKYNIRTNTFSLIQADYLLSTPYSENDIYIFLSKQDNSEICFCRSFFPKDKKDYTIGQPQYTMLYKEKINLTTGEKEIQFDRLYGYRTASKEEVEALRKADMKIDILSETGKELSIRYFLRNEKKINSVLQQYNSMNSQEQIVQPTSDTHTQQFFPLSRDKIKESAKIISSKQQSKDKEQDKPHRKDNSIE